MKQTWREAHRREYKGRGNRPEIIAGPAKPNHYEELPLIPAHANRLNLCVMSLVLSHTHAHSLPSSLPLSLSRSKRVQSLAYRFIQPDRLGLIHRVERALGQRGSGCISQNSIQLPIEGLGVGLCRHFARFDENMRRPVPGEARPRNSRGDCPEPRGIGLWRAKTAIRDPSSR
jgi:hypothetical protein